MQNHENQRRYKKHVLCLSNGATPKCTEKRHDYWSIHTPPKSKKHESLIVMAALNTDISKY